VSGERREIARLGRALLSEAIRSGSTLLEIGLDRRGGFARAHHPEHPPFTRRLPAAVIAAVIGWVRGRVGGGDPFEEEGFYVAFQPDRAEVGRIWVTAESVAEDLLFLSLPKAAYGNRGEGACFHQAGEGDVFCLRCGAAL